MLPQENLKFTNHLWWLLRPYWLVTRGKGGKGGSGCNPCTIPFLAFNSEINLLTLSGTCCLLDISHHTELPANHLHSLLHNVKSCNCMTFPSTIYLCLLYQHRQCLVGNVDILKCLLLPSYWRKVGETYTISNNAMPDYCSEDFEKPWTPCFCTIAWTDTIQWTIKETNNMLIADEFSKNRCITCFRTPHVSITGDLSSVTLIRFPIISSDHLYRANMLAHTSSESMATLINGSVMLRVLIILTIESRAIH